MRNTAGLPIGKATFKHVPLGTGGQLIQGCQSTDGTTKVVCADQHGAYVLGSTDKTWRPLFTSTAIPAGLQIANQTYTGAYNDQSGCPDAVVAPSSASTIYMIWDGYVLKSTDTGATFTQTTCPRKTFNSNGPGSKSWGHALTVDPNNANVVLYGTQQDTVLYTTNGGTTWTDLVVTASGNGPDGHATHHITACDPTSTQTSGIRQGWFYSSYGTGVYHSTAGPGGPYTLLNTTGMPTNVEGMICDAAGTLWVITYGVVNSVSKWTAGGGWVKPAGFTGQYDVIAVDPANTSRIALSYGGTYYLSTDGGATISKTWGSDLGQTAQIYREKSIRYMDVGPYKGYHPNANGMWFDPTVPGRLWTNHGCGICYTDLATPGTQLVWYSIGEGVEELVAHTFCAIPGGKRLMGCWDMGVFDIIDTTRPVNPQKYPIAGTDSWSGQTIPPVIQQPCSSIDYAADNPNWVAFMYHGGWYSVPINAPHMCYSTDGGNTLQMFPTAPPNKPFSNGGGSLAVGNAGNVIVVWNTNARAVYTKDGGTTWADVPIPGIPANGTESGWEWQGNGFFLNKFVITYDKAGGFFYAFNYGPTSNTSLLGIWKSSNGDSWTQQCTVAPSANYVYSCHLRSVPGQAGHLFFTPGDGSLNFTGQPSRSTNGGVTWTTGLTTNGGQAITNVSDFGFGKAATGKTYPSIYFWGQVNGGAYGLYRSDDNLVTSTLLSNNPTGALDYPMVVAGDPDVYGRVWLCMSGNGVIVGDYDYHTTVH